MTADGAEELVEVRAAQQCVTGGVEAGLGSGFDVSGCTFVVLVILIVVLARL